MDDLLSKKIHCLTLLTAIFLPLIGSLARGQEIPAPEPFGSRTPISEAPKSSLPEATAEPAAMSRESQLEERVRQLEAIVSQLSTQIGQSSQAAAGGAGGTAFADVPSPASAVAPSSMGGVGAPGQSLPPNPAPSARFDSPATLESIKGNVKFGPGFEIRSEDDEYIFQFHNLTQFEYRGYEQYGQSSSKDSFLFPRQWFMFSGRITKPIGYFVSLANGFDTVTALDVFLDFEYDPRFRIRMGRFKTPFTYEFFVEPIQGLIVPERSIFFNNFGQNRDLGVMPYGRIFGSLDYAVGIFNGNRNGYVAPSDSKFISAFVNYRPFNALQDTPFENLNIGGSVFGGNADKAPSPQLLRTIVPMVGNAVAGVPFLGFNHNIREAGMMTFWDMHMAYFYRSLAVIGEWASGFQSYAPANNLTARTRLPVSSFYIEAGYLLTGETRSSLGLVKPHHPFNPLGKEFGLGAWELTGRYSQLNISDQVFTNGLSDPNLWANRVNLIDLGFNWHLTQYVKFMFNWERADFNQPVYFAPGRRQITSDLFIARMQLYF